MLQIHTPPSAGKQQSSGRTQCLGRALRANQFQAGGLAACSYRYCSLGDSAPPTLHDTRCARTSQWLPSSIDRSRVAATVALEPVLRIALVAPDQVTVWILEVASNRCATQMTQFAGSRVELCAVSWIATVSRRVTTRSTLHTAWGTRSPEASCSPWRYA